MGLRIQSRQLLTSNRKRVAVFLGVLTLVLQPVLSSNIPGVFAAGPTETVSGNTTTTENSPGKWFFNRDASTASSYEFNSTEKSTGNGALHVKPIGTSPADKFIGEHYVANKLDDTGDISFDYRLGTGVPANKVEHIYMNVYVNFESTTNYGDCVYTVVSNNATGWNTLTFNADQSYDVRKRNTAPADCEAIPSSLPSTAYVRAIALTVGDTTVNDAGVSAYLDNVRIVKTSGTSVYNFENAAPETAITSLTDGQRISGNHSLRITAKDDALEKYSYRIRKVNADNSNTPDSAIVDKVVTSSQSLTDEAVFSWDTTMLGEGKYYVYVSASDVYGMRSERRIYVTVDNTAPSAPNRVTPSPYVTNGLANKTLQWTASSSDVDYYEYAEYNSIAPATDTTPSDWDKSVDGTSTTDTAWQSDIKIYWRVRAVDTAGNKSGWSTTGVILRDKTKPTVSVSSAPSVNPGSLTITGNDNLGLKRVVGNIYRGSNTLVKSNQAAGNSLTVNLSTLPDGAYYVKYNSEDDASNISTTSNFYFTIDTTVSIQGVEYSNNGGPNTAPVTVTMTFDEDVTRADVTWETQDNKVFTKTFASNTSGNVLFEDLYGNSVSVPYTVQSIALPIVTNESLVVPQGSNPGPVVGQQGQRQPQPANPGSTFIAAVNNGSTNTVATPATPAEDSGDVLGLSSTDPKRTTAAVAGASDKAGWSLGDMAWYWWLAIVAGLVALWLLFAAALRRFRGDEA